MNPNYKAIKRFGKGCKLLGRKGMANKHFLKI